MKKQGIMKLLIDSLWDVAAIIHLYTELET